LPTHHCPSIHEHVVQRGKRGNVAEAGSQGVAASSSLLEIQPTIHLGVPVHSTFFCAVCAWLVHVVHSMQHMQCGTADLHTLDNCMQVALCWHTMQRTDRVSEYTNLGTGPLGVSLPCNLFRTLAGTDRPQLIRTTRLHRHDDSAGIASLTHLLGIAQPLLEMARMPVVWV
jgi:hypothetical protein